MKRKRRCSKSKPPGDSYQGLWRRPSNCRRGLAPFQLVRYRRVATVIDAFRRSTDGLLLSLGLLGFLGLLDVPALGVVAFCHRSLLWADRDRRAFAMIVSDAVRWASGIRGLYDMDGNVSERTSLEPGTALYGTKLPAVMFV
jgi:hypothetical protein